MSEAVGGCHAGNEEKISRNDMPMLAKITITPDDYRQIRKLYKEMPQQTKDAITAVIKARQRENCDQHISDLLAIMAVFAKFTTQKRDRDLIIKTFNLDDSDFLYLTAELAPADGGRDVVCTIQPDDQQPERLRNRAQTGRALRHQ